jgi:hypothetical protein
MNNSIILSSPLTQDFHFKRFQLEDYARGALHDGLILGHDTGLGKSIALYVWPALKVGFETQDPGSQTPVRSLRPLAPILLVVPGDLHEQTIREGEEKFKATVTRLDCHDTFLRLSTPNRRDGKRELPPGYYITSYTQLTGNGVTPFPEFQPDNIVGMMQILGLSDADSGEYFDQREELFARHYQRLSALPSMTLAELDLACRQAQNQYAGNDAMQHELTLSYEKLEPFHCAAANPGFTDLPPEKKVIVRARMTALKYQEYAASVGQSEWYGKSKSGGGVPPPTPSAPHHCPAGVLTNEPVGPVPSPGVRPFKVKCLYSPSLADLCQDAFTACAVDEGVRMKGEDSLVGLGVRQINAKYKLVLTATPIKNRLPDVFRLAWWATGARPDAHARFPYPDATAARTEFAEQFLISERNLTKEREKPSRFKKLTPQVCNVHRLWKMFAPIILRRRKADAGEDIVTKTRQVVRAPMGKEQAAVYKFHLEALYRDKNGGPAIGAQLQALRVAAANPASQLLVRPLHDEQTKGDPRSKATYIPKLHSALKLIHQCLANGEQAVVFSAFNDSLDGVSHRLTEAGVPHCVVDGRTSQKRRGQLAAQFKLGPGRSPYQVMLAGVECMAEGHSFPLCPNVILLAYSWAWDKFEQAINRVHRLNSRWPVKVWAIICERSIDRKLEGMLQEKGDACELVLDGHLQGEPSDEVNLAELLDIARKEFADGKNIVTIEETQLEKEWPALRTDLNAAVKAWRLKGLELMGITVAAGVPPAELLGEATVGPVPSPGVSTEPSNDHSSLPARQGCGEATVAPVPTPGVPCVLSVPDPRPETPDTKRPQPRILDLQAEDLTLFAGLPLFDLAS